MKYFLFCLVATMTLAQDHGRFSRDSVKEILDSGKVHSVESFLKALSESKYKAFLENYALMFHSLSLQSASFENPRAIMFSKKDDFVIAFNGDSSHEGGNQLEMIEFDHKERAFKFFEVDFNNPSSEVLSDFNPPKCLSCHKGPDPRPNWEPYFFWPGMYGGVDDGLTVQIAYLTKKYGKNFAEDIPHSEREVFSDLFESREGKEYMKFNQSKKHHPRYSWLIDYKYPEDREDLNMQRGDTGPNSIRPGVLLTNMLHDLNIKRLQRKVEEAARAAPPFVYAIFGASFGPSYCTLSSSTPYHFSLKNFIPDHLQIQKDELQNYINNQRKLTEANFKKGIDRHTEATRDEVSGEKDDTANMGRLGRIRTSSLTRPTLAPIKYVMELAGLDIDDWSMSLSGMPRLARTTGMSDLTSILPLLEELGERNIPISSLCKELPDRSLTALKSVYNKKTD